MSIVDIESFQIFFDRACSWYSNRWSLRQLGAVDRGIFCLHESMKWSSWNCSIPFLLSSRSPGGKAYLPVTVAKITSLLSPIIDSKTSVWHNASDILWKLLKLPIPKAAISMALRQLLDRTLNAFTNTSAFFITRRKNIASWRRHCSSN